MSRADIVRQAFLRYHRGHITLRQLLAVLTQWRPKP